MVINVPDADINNLQNLVIYRVNVGKYASTMEHMGVVVSPQMGL